MTSNAKELMAYSFLVVFANDNIIDEAELAMLERIALEDNVVDDAEKEVLRGIFSRVEGKPISEEVTREIEHFRQQYQI